jgi:hypothetical protein
VFASDLYCLGIGERCGERPGTGPLGGDVSLAGSRAAQPSGSGSRRGTTGRPNELSLQDDVNLCLNHAACEAGR